MKADRSRARPQINGLAHICSTYTYEKSKTVTLKGKRWGGNLNFKNKRSITSSKDYHFTHFEPRMVENVKHSDGSQCALEHTVSQLSKSTREQLQRVTAAPPSHRTARLCGEEMKNLNKSVSPEPQPCQNMRDPECFLMRLYNGIFTRNPELCSLVEHVVLY